MVSDELVVVLAGLFEAKHENDELLTPVSKLHQVVSLHVGYHIPVRITYRSYVSRQETWEEE